MTRMNARYNSPCYICNEPIHAGDLIDWDAPSGLTRHDACHPYEPPMGAIYIEEQESAWENGWFPRRRTPFVVGETILNPNYRPWNGQPAYLTIIHARVENLAPLVFDRKSGSFQYEWEDDHLYVAWGMPADAPEGMPATPPLPEWVTPQATEATEATDGHSPMTEEQAAQLQPGDVVYHHDGSTAGHFVVSQVRPTGIAAPLFYLERIHDEQYQREMTYTETGWPINPRNPGWTSYKLCALPDAEYLATHPARQPYYGPRGPKYQQSARTQREAGERTHPLPSDPDRPDEVSLNGARLRERRAALVLSQAELAAELGVPANTIARWERGELTIRNPVMVDLALQTLERERGMGGE